jgi:hypothetical protein
MRALFIHFDCSERAHHAYVRDTILTDMIDLLPPKSLVSNYPVDEASEMGSSSSSSIIVRAKQQLNDGKRGREQEN